MDFSNCGPIAVVDDNPKIRLLLEEELSDLNCSASFFEDAFSLYEAAKNTEFAILFIDLMIPHVNGIECVKQVRANGYQGLIFVFSALVDEELRSQAIASGANDYLAKSQVLGNIEELISRVME